MSRGGPALPWLAVLGATLLMQTAVALTSQALPVMAPLLTESGGLPPQAIGYLTGFAALGTALYLMAGGPVLARFGPVRTLQLGAVVFTLATAGFTLGWPLALFAAALLRGIGDGPTVPAGSRILARTAPPEHRTLIFSVKQAGAPLGGMLAGLALPPLALAVGWRATLLLAALLVLACAAAVQPLRAQLDADRDERRAIGLRALLAPANLASSLNALRTHPALPPLALVSVSLAVVQGCLFAFTVTLLTEAHGYGLAEAGMVFAGLQAGGLGARLVLGWLADRTGVPMVNLLVQIAMAAAATTAFALAPALVPLPLVLAAAVVAGAAGASWQGIVLAEYARLAPPDRMAEATAGVSLCAFLAYFAGPAAFALLVGLVGGWTGPMLLVAAQAGLVALMLAPRLVREAQAAPIRAGARAPGR